MTREDIAVKLAQDEQFKQLPPDRQQAVFETAVQQIGEISTPNEPSPPPENAWTNLVTRPAAAIRGGLQAMLP